MSQASAFVRGTYVHTHRALAGLVEERLIVFNQLLDASPLILDEIYDSLATCRSALTTSAPLTRFTTWGLSRMRPSAAAVDS